MKKYVYAAIVFVIGLLATSLIGEGFSNREIIPENMSGALASFVFVILIFISLLCSLVVYCTLFIVDEIRKNK